MENYLGVKTKMGNKIDYILIAIFGMLVIAGISVIIKEQADAGMSIAIAAVNSSVIVFAVLRIRMRALAMRLAKYFFASPDSEMSVEDIRQKLGLKDLNRSLGKLIDKKYLKNVAFNEGNNTVTILGEHKMVTQQQFYVVDCPNCGGQNRIQKGRICKCTFCDTELIAGQNVKV